MKITSEESIERGISILDKVELTDNEWQKIENIKKTLLNESEIEEFESKYEAWRKTWSNPEINYYNHSQQFNKIGEFIDLYNYCISKDKKVLPLILEKLNAGDFYVIFLLEDLTYSDNEKMMEEVRLENRENQYTKDSVFVIHTLLDNWLKFGKKLLASFDDYKGFNSQMKELQLDERNVIQESKLVIQNYPNPFNPITQINYNIPSDNRISIIIYDILGNKISVLVDNEFQTAGWHNIKWNGTDINSDQVSSGIYFCQITSGSLVNTIKLMMLR